MTTLPTWRRVQGDVDDTIVSDLDGVADLTGVTSVTARVWRTVAPVSSTALTGAIVDSPTAVVSINLSTWLLTAAPGWWNVMIKATWASSATRSWPGRLLVDAAPPTS